MPRLDPRTEILSCKLNLILCISYNCTAVRKKSAMFLVNQIAICVWVASENNVELARPVYVCYHTTYKLIPIENPFLPLWIETVNQLEWFCRSQKLARFLFTDEKIRSIWSTRDKFHISLNSEQTLVVNISRNDFLDIVLFKISLPYITDTFSGFYRRSIADKSQPGFFETAMILGSWDRKPWPKIFHRETKSGWRKDRKICSSTSLGHCLLQRSHRDTYVVVMDYTACCRRNFVVYIVLYYIVHLQLR